MPFRVFAFLGLIVAPFLLAAGSEVEDSGFSIGEDKKVKMVSTFLAPPTMERAFKSLLRSGDLFPGYKETQFDDSVPLMETLVKELEDSDFYVPANNSFPYLFPSERAELVRFEKERDGVKAEVLVLVVSPTKKDRTELQPHLPKLFQYRRSLAEKRRLHVLGLFGASHSGIRPWLKSFSESLDPKTENGEPDSWEIPLYIGANRSFPTASREDLVKPARYPAMLLELALKEARYSEWITALDQAGFVPVSNLESK